MAAFREQGMAAFLILQKETKVGTLSFYQRNGTKKGARYWNSRCALVFADRRILSSSMELRTSWTKSEVCCTNLGQESKSARFAVRIRDKKVNQQLELQNNPWDLKFLDLTSFHHSLNVSLKILMSRVTKFVNFVSPNLNQIIRCWKLCITQPSIFIR